MPTLSARHFTGTTAAPRDDRPHPAGQRSASPKISRAVPDAPQDRTDITAATTAIAALRGRLRRPGMLDHPAVRRELRKLEEQLSALPEHAGRKPGRHRAQPGMAPRLHHDEPDHTSDPTVGRTPADQTDSHRPPLADMPTLQVAAHT
jgi:hypothetical protein